MHHPTDRIIHTTAFVTPVVEHWLERVTAIVLVVVNSGNYTVTAILLLADVSFLNVPLWLWEECFDCVYDKLVPISVTNLSIFGYFALQNRLAIFSYQQ